MGKFLRFLLSAVLTLIALVPVSSASATVCEITWGSLPKSGIGLGEGSLTNIRTGQHTCYDRMVFDIPGAAEGYHVEYVPDVYADGSGQLIPLTGGAKLQVRLDAPAYDPNTGAPTYGGVTGQPLPGVNLAGYQTFKSAKFAGSFEGQTTVGVGVRARLPFRAFTLDNRVVVDVAHRW